MNPLARIATLFVVMVALILSAKAVTVVYTSRDIIEIVRWLVGMVLAWLAVSVVAALAGQTH